ncbi:hypothetical protein [Psychromicrobium sp. YIM B11713]|uniref:hypothetical protein n=1 Tax=Psychromicrobium sp. YIM B11713 TaxID=3145233 RepID=UPI00374E983C
MTAHQSTTQPSLSPYDTGVRLEPRNWLPYGTTVADTTPVENFGKVDFNDDAGETTAVAYIEREDGKYTMHVTPLCEGRDLRVVLHAEDGEFVLTRDGAADARTAR